MQCPNCSAHNEDHVVICTNCGTQLPTPGLPDEPIQIRTSRLAVAALVLGLLSLPTFGITAVPAVIVGIIAIVVIDSKGGRLTGKGMAGLGVILATIGFMLLATRVMIHPHRSLALRMVCGTNLSCLGKAMLIYANDYNDEFPRAGGKNLRWTAKTPDWLAVDPEKAFSMDSRGNGGEAAITASLYLLVKYAEATPKSFICVKGDDLTEFRLNDYELGNTKLTDVWDFGPEPAKHCSYAYHTPYGEYALTLSSQPGMAVLADRNPWQKSSKARDLKQWNSFDPSDQRDGKKLRYGNTTLHNGEGQNVLFVDSHVDFYKRPTVGIDGDNIYTSWDGTDRYKGIAPRIGSEQANKEDSLLVHDGAGVVER